jgi:predicted AAA+ superfamily ATPase
MVVTEQQILRTLSHAGDLIYTPLQQNNLSFPSPIGLAPELAGRGLTFELFGFSAHELGGAFDLERMLNHGYLPPIYLSERPERLLNTYVAQYLKEEIAEKGLLRRLPAFSEFLNAASFSDCSAASWSHWTRKIV